MNRVLILAGGIGERCKTDNIPKQFLQLNGKDIILHTVSVFETSDNIDEIYIVCKNEWQDYCNKLMHDNNIIKFIKCINNGDTCLESIYNGLKELTNVSNDEDLIFIHDSVRPFIDNKLINELVSKANIYGNCIPVANIIETPTIIKDDIIIKTVNRATAFTAKAPQVFKFKTILDCYKNKESELNNYCDSAQIAFSNNVELHTILCDTTNIKITSRMDFYLARALLNCKEDKQFI